MSERCSIINMDCSYKIRKATHSKLKLNIWKLNTIETDFMRFATYPCWNILSSMLHTCSSERQYITYAYKEHLSIIFERYWGRNFATITYRRHARVTVSMIIQAEKHDEHWIVVYDAYCHIQSKPNTIISSHCFFAIVWSMFRILYAISKQDGLLIIAGKVFINNPSISSLLIVVYWLLPLSHFYSNFCSIICYMLYVACTNFCFLRHIWNASIAVEMLLIKMFSMMCMLCSLYNSQVALQLEAYQ